MIKAIAKLRGVSQLQYGRYHNTPKKERENDKDYEQRTWIERLHVDSDNNIIIPPMAFKHCVTGAAQRSGIKIPGKGRSTYTKHFKAGILVTEPLVLPYKKNDASPLWLFVPSDGKHGSGKRVEKCFPILNGGWEGEVTFYILDRTITESVFKQVLTEAGQFVGLLSFRPENGGYFGRFAADAVQWIDEEKEAEEAEKSSKKAKAANQ